MKKTLASCLTALTLLGSVCFSSPMAQVHANETNTEQSSGTVPIDLNVDETITRYEHYITTKLKPGDIIKVNNIKLSDYSGSGVNVNYDGNEFTATKRTSSNYLGLLLETTTENKDYLIWGEITEAAEGDNKTVIEIDLSKTSNYEAKIGETEEGKDITTPVKVTPTMRLSIDKTTKTLPAGSSFELKLPEKIASTYEEKYKFKNYISTIKELKINEIAIEDDQYSNYIKEVDPQNPWKISLLPTIKTGDKVSFKACSVKNEASTTQTDSDEPALVTYQSEPPQEEKYPQILSPNVEEYPFPVELTIVEKEKDENINNKEDEIKDEINSEKEPSSGEDEAPIDKEENDNEESSTAVKTGDNSIYAIIFAAFAAIVAKVLISLCSKKTVKK